VAGDLAIGRADGSGSHPPEPRRGRFARRALDLTVAGLGLVVLALLMLLIGLLVRLTSPGPALFRQVRVGEHGRQFRMLKFRTMEVGCDDELHRRYVTRMLRAEDLRAESGGLYKLDDPRVTRLGRLLRRTSLDELPQLINVVRGEMSLVGPRPMLPWEYELLSPTHRERFAVPAGITGLWQVSGRSELTMTQALDLDVQYARTAGALLDLRILLKTVWVVLVPRGRAR
jgi:lipopolysaccharide/colanic/teichoic acid biosynthesis glycosyltransferase